ncbi:hypothetical protein [Rhizobium sp. BK176]|uniref:hypothetical protein n=1 Tax=Rhizobium sp. BK176 TaxID=2587071 RepID=UPI0021673532|nr:hypothetical protein [Rhizobium sp. BK176]MCS4088789.1 hypothetical protein [Rhizobium sp. BK176]
MRAVSACLQSLFLTTSGFSKVCEEDFACPEKGPLLLAGKRLTCLGSAKENIEAWKTAGVVFEHADAAGRVVAAKLRIRAAEMVNFVFDETAQLTRVTPEWIMAHPYTLPVFANATGTVSKKRFKNQFKLTAASDRSIGRTDATRIVEGIQPGMVLAPREVVAGMESLIEGIVRDQIGKVVNEAFIQQALDRRDVPYVRDEGGSNQIEGLVSASRADIAAPDNSDPKVFIEVRKSTANHASLYASSLMFSALDRRGRHPNSLAIMLYDGAWSGATKALMENAFHYVFHVLESDQAADIVKRHLDGEDMRPKRPMLTLSFGEATGTVSDHSATEVEAISTSR